MTVRLFVTLLQSLGIFSQFTFSVKRSKWKSIPDFVVSICMTRFCHSKIYCCVVNITATQIVPVHKVWTTCWFWKQDILVHLDKYLWVPWHTRGCGAHAGLPAPRVSRSVFLFKIANRWADFIYLAVRVGFRKWLLPCAWHLHVEYTNRGRSFNEYVVKQNRFSLFWDQTKC